MQVKLNLALKQMFDPKNGAQLTLKLGYRNLLGFLDHTNFEYNQYIQQKQNSLNLSTTFPFFLGSTSLTLGHMHNSRDIQSNLQEHLQSSYINLSHKNIQFQIQYQIIKNQFTQYYQNDFNLLLPISKTTLKVSQELINNLEQFNLQNQAGQYLQNQNAFKPLIYGQKLSYSVELGKNFIKPEIKQTFVTNFTKNSFFEFQASFGYCNSKRINDFFPLQNPRGSRENLVLQKYGFLGLKIRGKQQMFPFVFGDFWLIDKQVQTACGVGYALKLSDSFKLEADWVVKGIKGFGGIQVRMSIND